MRLHQSRPGELLASYPDFVLHCRYDDEDDPSELTVFTAGDGEPSTTEWITADVGSTVAIDDLR